MTNQAMKIVVKVGADAICRNCTQFCKPSCEFYDAKRQMFQIIDGLNINDKDGEKEEK